MYCDTENKECELKDKEQVERMKKQERRTHGHLYVTSS